MSDKKQTTQTTAQNIQERMTKPTKGHTFLPVVLTSSIARNKLTQMKQNVESVKMLNINRYHPEMMQPLQPNK